MGSAAVVCDTCAMKAALAIANFAICRGHGTMMYPPTWMDPNGDFFARGDEWREANCAPGNRSWDSYGWGCLENFYTNYTFIPGNPTIAQDSPMRTMKDPDGLDVFAKNPWRAPGTAPINSPCGVDGGNPDGCPPGNPDPYACAGGGWGHGKDARELPGNTKPTEWTVGAVEELVWGLHANHAGGYQYRLCPKPASSWDLTEECFQKMPLTLLGDTQWIQWHSDPATRKEIPARRTRNGTTPMGSQWTANPLPTCDNIFDFSCAAHEFQPPVPGAYGFWGIYNAGVPQFGMGRMHNISIVDKFQVPSDLSPGDYVLQFRWDCEQTSQVWFGCADVQISASSQINV